MTQFQVLDGQQDIQSSRVLEASAGTGKTFTIEHLVVRLLIEGERPPALEEILVVTFTRAATQELQQRVRSNIHEALRQLQVFLATASWDKDCAPYLRERESLGRESLFLAKRRLQAALLAFSSARIFTIHGFCYRSLTEARTDFTGDDGCEPISTSRLRLLIRDFFRTELTETLVSPGQLKLLLGQHRQDILLLESRLARWIAHALPIIPGFDLGCLQAEWRTLQGELNSRLLDQMQEALTQFNGVCDSQKRPKAYVRRAFLRLNSLVHEPLDLDAVLGDVLELFRAFAPENRKKRLKELADTSLIEQARSRILPLLELASDPLKIFATIAARCQDLLRRRQHLEGWRGPDDLLSEMSRAVDDTAFCRQMATATRVAIIDEFQDTDPLQWRIFSQLFLDRDVLLYLVGDPKQSIYAFRQADIYTYLNATRSLGEDATATLDVNYRSQPNLIEALNALFSGATVEGWISLPRTGEALPYRRVASPPDAEPWCSSNTTAALHFFVAEGAAGRAKRWPTPEIEAGQLLPFLVRELRVLADAGQHFADCAVLVRDRFQASRVHDTLKDHGIPAIVRRAESVLQSAAYPALVDLLRAIMNPKNASDLRVALGGSLLGWTEDDLLTLDDSSVAEQVLARVQNWRQLLYEKSFAAFYRSLIVEERARILAREDGLDLYEALQQLSELLVQHQGTTRCTPEGLVTFLEELPTWELDDDERIMLRQDPQRDAVQILSIHMSKGLEFPFVFALGLCQRSSRRSDLIANADSVQAYSEEDAAVEAHYREMDAEKMRQLYVAMTRAKLRLYVPLAYQQDSRTELQPGEGAPIELFLQRLGEGQEEQLSVLRSLPHCSLSMLLDAPPIEDKIPQPAADIILSKPRQYYPDIQESRILSFTALARSQGSSSNRTPDNVLPAGSQTGTILHGLLELIARQGFADWLQQSDSEAWVAQKLQGTLLEAWASDCYRMLIATLNTPLKPFSFCLAEVKQCIPEMEFLYKDASGRLIKGFIDLVFQHDSALYIVDWKSNWLPSYEDPELSACIESHDYGLQAQLYQEAVQRWSGGQLPCAGAFYLFLRGLPQQGIHYFPLGDRS